MSILSALLFAYLAFVFSVDFLLIHFDGVPRELQLVADGLAALILIFAALHASSRSLIRIPGKYVVIFLLLLMLMIVGIVVNNVQPGAIFWGARKYFRYVPILLLPMLVDFKLSERVLQLKVFLFFAFWQLPAVVYQWRTFRPEQSKNTGDSMIGTLTNSGALTVFLTATLLVWTAFYVKGRVNILVYLAVLPFLLLPTWMNETSSSLVLLPMAIGLPFLLHSAPGSTIRKFATMGSLVALLTYSFVWFYSTNFERWGGDVTNVLSEDGLEYLYRGADLDSRADGWREHSEIGRVDSIVIPFLYLDDIEKLLVGVGIGNASLVRQDEFVGAYTHLNKRYGIDHTTYAHLIWEIGVLGLLLCGFFLWFAFKHARALSRYDGSEGAVGLAVASLIPFIVVCCAYKNLIFALPVGVGVSLLIGHAVALRTEIFFREELQVSGKYNSVVPKPNAVQLRQV